MFRHSRGEARCYNIVVIILNRKATLNTHFTRGGGWPGVEGGRRGGVRGRECRFLLTVSVLSLQTAFSKVASKQTSAGSSVLFVQSLMGWRCTNTVHSHALGCQHTYETVRPLELRHWPLDGNTWLHGVCANSCEKGQYILRCWLPWCCYRATPTI